MTTQNTSAPAGTGADANTAQTNQRAQNAIPDVVSTTVWNDGPPRTVRWDLLFIDGDGEPGSLAAAVRTVSMDAPPSVVHGLSRQHMSVIYGECICGARAQIPNRATRRAIKRANPGSKDLFTSTVDHENGCPADEAILLPLIRAWRESPVAEADWAFVRQFGGVR